MDEHQPGWAARQTGVFFTWIRRPRAWFAIGAAAAFARIGHYLANHDILTELATLTGYVDQSLRSISATGLARTFYRNLTGCDVTWPSAGLRMLCQAGPPTADNGYELPSHLLLLPLWLLNAIWVTAKSVWVSGTVGSLVIFVPSLIVGGIVVGAWLDSRRRPAVGPDSYRNPFWHAVAIALLTPAVASLLALALKFVLVACVYIFSSVLGGVAWLVFSFGGAFAWLYKALGFVGTVQDIDSLAQGFAGGADAAPKAKSGARSGAQSGGGAPAAKPPGDA